MAASAVLCSFALLSGCSDDDVCKVYIPEAKTLQIKNFDLGEELREVFHVAVTASDYVTRSGKEVGGDVKVQLTVMRRRCRSIILCVGQTILCFLPIAIR